MNISKAKAVMIIVFLVLNIFLAYQLLAPGWNGMGLAVTQEEIQRMEDKLHEYNYEADVPIPRNFKSSSFLVVKAPGLDPEEVKRQFLNDQSVNKNILEDKIIYEAEGAILEVYQKGYYHYRLKDNFSNATNDDVGQIDKQVAVEIAKEFLTEKGIGIENAGIYNIINTSAGNYKITYYQEFSQTPLFSGYINIAIEEGLVSEVESYWLRIVGMEERREMEVIPATVAVMRLLEDIGPAYRKRCITKLDLGFYSQEYDAEQWEVPPVWRIEIDEEDIYYVNAFTGNIEPEGPETKNI